MQNISFPQVTDDRVLAEHRSMITEKVRVLVIRKPKTDVAALDLHPASLETLLDLFFTDFWSACCSRTVVSAHACTTNTDRQVWFQLFLSHREPAVNDSMPRT